MRQVILEDPKIYYDGEGLNKDTDNYAALIMKPRKLKSVALPNNEARATAQLLSSSSFFFLVFFSSFSFLFLFLLLLLSSLSLFLFIVNSEDFYSASSCTVVEHRLFLSLQLYGRRPCWPNIIVSVKGESIWVIYVRLCETKHKVCYLLVLCCQLLLSWRHLKFVCDVRGPQQSDNFLWNPTQCYADLTLLNPSKLHSTER